MKGTELSSKISITSVEFKNYKALPQYSVSLQHMNILVGPNNCGKSTIISSFRALAAGIRRARAKSVEVVPGPDGQTFGYSLPEESIPISIENVHTDYADADASVTFRLSNGNKLQLFFPEKGGCFLIPLATKSVKTPTQFKSSFPIVVGVVPVLGPVEHEEESIREDTVKRNLATHRASRHFRNYWYYFPEGFDDFAKLIEKTWLGITIDPPSKIDIMSPKLTMFCYEKRIPREIFWAGFGFQIWCQLLTHISRAQNDTLLIIDEPEIYLHPDVQRQLLNILRESGPDILLATHSTEIMGEADHSEILLVDKEKKSAHRLKDIEGVQQALEIVGSIQNITLTQLARNRRLIFVEGLGDFRIIRRFAQKIGLSELASGIDLTPAESGGFSSWESIRSFASVFEKAVGRNLNIGVVYDRDYLSEEQVQSIIEDLRKHLDIVHIHGRKEIENYLLIPNALEKALSKAIQERARRSGGEIVAPKPVSELLDEITTPFRSDIQAQYLEKRSQFLRHTKSDGATINSQTIKTFEEKWRTIEKRMEIVPGKDVLKKLRERVKNDYSVNLTDNKIIDEINKEDIPEEFLELIYALEKYRSV